MISNRGIFVSGSIAGRSIPAPASYVLDEIVTLQRPILVGDAPGIDTIVQRYLARVGYPLVEIFHVGPVPRNCLSDIWRSTRVDVDESDPTQFKAGKYTREAQSQKDRIMADQAAGGLAIWREMSINRFGKASVSKGTLGNMVRLLADQKPVVLYHFENPRQCVVHLWSVEDLVEYVKTHSAPQVIVELERRMKSIVQDDPTLF